MIGGQKRYFSDQCGGGRTDGTASAAQRLWYAANVGAAGLPMIMMGTEWMQTGWWEPGREPPLELGPRGGRDRTGASPPPPSFSMGLGT